MIMRVVDSFLDFMAGDGPNDLVYRTGAFLFVVIAAIVTATSALSDTARDQDHKCMSGVEIVDFAKAIGGTFTREQGARFAFIKIDEPIKVTHKYQAFGWSHNGSPEIQYYCFMSTDYLDGV